MIERVNENYNEVSFEPGSILPLPLSKWSPSSVCFGGPDFNILYLSYGDKVYRRKLKTRGANTFDKPIKPVVPRL